MRHASSIWILILFAVVFLGCPAGGSFTQEQALELARKHYVENHRGEVYYAPRIGRVSSGWRVEFLVDDKYTDEALDDGKTFRKEPVVIIVSDNGECEEIAIEQ